MRLEEKLEDYNTLKSDSLTVHKPNSANEDKPNQIESINEELLPISNAEDLTINETITEIDTSDPVALKTLYKNEKCSKSIFKLEKRLGEAKTEKDNLIINEVNSALKKLFKKCKK